MNQIGPERVSNVTMGKTVENSWLQKNVALLCILIFGIVVWLYLPSLNGDLLFYDESSEIAHNSHVTSGLSWDNFTWAFGSLDFANWHPMTWLSKMLDCELYGLDPWGHHLTNVLIHALNTVLVFLVLKRTTGAAWKSLIVAALFGLHPLRVQSVAWVSERKDVLSMFFWMLTLWAYVRFTEESRMQSQRTKIFYGLTLVFFILGLTSKTMLVTLPFILLLLDYWPLESWRQRSKCRLVLEKTPHFLLAMVVSWIALIAQHKAGMTREMSNLPFNDRVGNALISYVRYIGKFFWPSGLSVYYPHPGHWPTAQVLLAALFVIGVSTMALLLRRRFPYLLTGWFWYLATLVPVIGLVQLLSQSIADRYTYIPMLGTALLLVWGMGDLAQLWRWRTVFISAVTVVTLLACVVRTRYELPYWKNDVMIHRRAVEVTQNENNWAPHYGLGVVLWSTPQRNQSLHEFQEAVRLNPQYVPAQIFLGCALSETNRWDEALVHFQKALALAPSNSLAWYNCGRVFFNKGQLDEAVVRFKKSVECEPNNAEHQAAQATVLRIRTQAGELNNQLREVLRLHPDHPAALNNLAWLLATSLDEHIRNGNEAVQLSKRACELTHYQVTGLVGTLATAYAEVGMFNEAITTSQRACSLASKAGEEDILKKNQELLVLFSAHLPYHEIADYDELAEMLPR